MSSSHQATNTLSFTTWRVTLMRQLHKGEANFIHVGIIVRSPVNQTWARLDLAVSPAMKLGTCYIRARFCLMITINNLMSPIHAAARMDLWLYSRGALLPLRKNVDQLGNLAGNLSRMWPIKVGAFRPNWVSLKVQAKLMSEMCFGYVSFPVLDAHYHW